MVNKPKVWSDGDILTHSDVNENSFQPLSPMDATDNGLVSHNTSTYTTKRTLDIGANQISSYVIIRFNLRPYEAHEADTDLDTASAQVTIDGAQKFEVTTIASGSYRDLSSGQATSDTITNVSVVHTHCFKYEPTAGEKSAGFTIDLDLKVGAGGENLTATNDYWEVWGA